MVRYRPTAGWSLVLSLATLGLAAALLLAVPGDAHKVKIKAEGWIAAQERTDGKLNVQGGLFNTKKACSAKRKLKIFAYPGALARAAGKRKRKELIAKARMRGNGNLHRNQQSNLVLRPEVRYDWADRDGIGFVAGAVDVITTFRDAEGARKKHRHRCAKVKVAPVAVTPAG